MPSPSSRPPSYRLHRPSGQAVVTLNGRHFYLGPHGAEASRKAYDRLVAEWLANGRRPVADDAVTIAELIDGYLAHSGERYRSNEQGNIASALAPLFDLYSETAAVEFGPIALKAVRARYVEAGNCRSTVNRKVRAVVRMFRWAVAEQLVPSSCWEALRALESLRNGTKGVKEGRKVRPIPLEVVEATLPLVSRQVAAMIRLQLLTGARPGEVCSMRGRDLTMLGEVWEYRPEHHKTEDHDIERVVFLGPAAQELLGPWLRDDPAEHLFQPREAETERMAAKRAARMTKVQPSQVDRSRSGRLGKLRDRYTADAYRNAVVRAVSRENERRKEQGGPLIPAWHPHQLRHTAATAIRKEYGIEVARTVLGHTSPAVTEIYAKADQDKARDAMGRMG